LEALNSAAESINKLENELQVSWSFVLSLCITLSLQTGVVMAGRRGQLLSLPQLSVCLFFSKVP